MLTGVRELFMYSERMLSSFEGPSVSRPPLGTGPSSQTRSPGGFHLVLEKLWRSCRSVPASWLCLLHVGLGSPCSGLLARHRQGRQLSSGICRHRLVPPVGEGPSLLSVFPCLWPPPVPLQKEKQRQTDTHTDCIHWLATQMPANSQG